MRTDGGNVMTSFLKKISKFISGVAIGMTAEFAVQARGF